MLVSRLHSISAFAQVILFTLIWIPDREPKLSALVGNINKVVERAGPVFSWLRNMVIKEQNLIK